MIQKVLPREYLKGYESMTVEEREAYAKRVGEWLRSYGERLLAITDRPMAQSQNLMLISARWPKEDCQAVHEGAVLLTALTGVTETWLPSRLWTRSAWGGVRKLVDGLSAIHNSQFIIHNEEGTAKSVQAEKQIVQTKEQTLNADKQAVDRDKVQTDVNTAQTISLEKTQVELGLVPVRPKHIDQYLHLLPVKTQERGTMVRGLLREMDEAREKARLLMGDDHASAESRAAWAKKATKIDEQLGKIYKELDREWEKLVNEGRVTVDDFGNAHVIEVKSEKLKVENESTHEPKRRGRKPLSEEEKAEREAQKRQENMRKAGLLRKWLIDLRNAKSPEQQEKWGKKYKEMVKLGGEESVTGKVEAAAEYYGVALDTLDAKPQGAEKSKK